MSLQVEHSATSQRQVVFRRRPGVLQVVLRRVRVLWRRAARQVRSALARPAAGPRVRTRSQRSLSSSRFALRKQSARKPGYSWSARAMTEDWLRVTLTTATAMALSRSARMWLSGRDRQVSCASEYRLALRLSIPPLAE